MGALSLDPTNRQRVLAAFMRDMRAPCPVTKTDLVAAIAAVDDWIDINQASYNTALPQPFRGAASAELKAELLAFVVMRRAGRLHAEEDG
ncbi:hypothetical protein [Streptomyces lasiicapitis]|uniref:hypothetical protein n=1 Tax=Streptomyces lasiicapitis TaxID=1923961 RepID=UPI0036C0E140